MSEATNLHTAHETNELKPLAVTKMKSTIFFVYAHITHTPMRMIFRKMVKRSA